MTQAAQTEIEVLKAALNEAVVIIDSLVENKPTSKSHILSRVRTFKNVLEGWWVWADLDDSPPPEISLDEEFF